MVDKKAVPVTFGVEEPALAVLAQFEPGDHVKVIYFEMGDKRIIKTIVKA